MGPYMQQNAQGWPSATPTPMYGWQPQMPMPYNSQAQMPPRQSAQTPITNIEFVTSLNEALIKTGMRGSDMLYMDQNRPVLYRVKVDEAGIKSYLELPYALPDQANSTPATKADIQMLLERLETVEKSISQVSTPAPATSGRKKKTEEIIDNGESNG